MCWLSRCPIIFLRRVCDARYKGPVREGDRVTRNTAIRFTWHILADGVNDSCDVELLCRHASRRGVPLPKAWKSAPPPVDAIAQSAVRRVRETHSLSDVVKLDCRHRCTCAHIRTHNSYASGHACAGILCFVMFVRDDSVCA